jgi:hypothetical protein
VEREGEGEDGEERKGEILPASYGVGEKEK